MPGQIQHYSLINNERTTLDMPVDARVLSVQTVEGTIWLWVLADVDAPIRPRTFEVWLTGTLVPNRCINGYLATCVVDGIACHIYEGFSH